MLVLSHIVLRKNGTRHLYLYGTTAAKPEKAKQEVVQDGTQLTGLAIERYFTRIHLEESNTKLEQYAKNLEMDVAQRTEEVESALEKLMESNLTLQTQIKTTQEAEERALAKQELFAAIARNFPKGVIMVFDTLMNYVHLEGEELDRIGLRNWLFWETRYSKPRALLQKSSRGWKRKCSKPWGTTPLFLRYK